MKKMRIFQEALLVLLLAVLTAAAILVLIKKKKSILGLMSLDYSKPVKIVVEDEEDEEVRESRSSSKGCGSEQEGERKGEEIDR